MDFAVPRDHIFHMVSSKSLIRIGEQKVDTRSRFFIKEKHCVCAGLRNLYPTDVLNAPVLRIARVYSGGCNVYR